MATIGSVIRQALSEGKTTTEVLTLVRREFPKAQTTSASVAWYRSQMKKEATKAGKAPIVKEPAKKELTKALDGARVPATYEVKGVKAISGTEGSGFECTLYRDGKRVAIATDAADGGPVYWRWFDHATQAEVHTYDYSDAPHTYIGTLEEALFAAFCNAKGTYPSPVEGGTECHYDMDIVVDELVNDVLLAKQFDKLTKKNTRIAYVNGMGALYTVNAAPTEENIKQYVTTTNAQVLNGLPVAEAVALLKSLQH